MEKSGIAFIYKEKFNSGVTPFSQMALEGDLRKVLRETFETHGGTYLLDLKISNTEKWRISYWKTHNGYKNWLSDKKLATYFEQRAKYNEQNQIKTELQGPIEAQELLHV